jgi:hypothetical protein
MHPLSHHPHAYVLTIDIKVARISTTFCGKNDYISPISITTWLMVLINIPQLIN